MGGGAGLQELYDHRLPPERPDGKEYGLDIIGGCWCHCRAGQTPVHRQHKRVRQYKRVPSAAGPRLWRALMLIGFVGLIGEAVARSRPQT